MSVSNRAVSRSLWMGSALCAVTVRSSGISGARAPIRPATAMVPVPAVALKFSIISSWPSARTRAVILERSTPCAKSWKLPPASETLPPMRGAAMVPRALRSRLSTPATRRPAASMIGSMRARSSLPPMRRSIAADGEIGAVPVTATWLAAPASSVTSTAAVRPCSAARAVIVAGGREAAGPVVSRSPVP